MTDIIFWEDWIANHPEKKDAVESARQVVNILSARQGNYLEQLTSLHQGIELQEKIKEILAGENNPADNILVADMPSGKNRSQKLWSAIAASLLVIVGGILLSQLFKTQNKISEKQATDFVFVTKSLQKKTIQLPDSSIIFLNENSKLILDKDFITHKRVAYLEGEAYFDVKHNSDYPFLLRTEKIDIQVLGTTFNVKAYKETNTYEAALLQGKIEILPNKFVKEKIVLNPNQQFVLRETQADKAFAKNKTLAISDSTFINKASTDSFTKLSEATKWSRHKMVFNNERLEMIAAKLQEWYGIEIIIKDPTVGNYRFTGTFDNENIINILTVLQTSYSFDFYVKDNIIYISK